MTGVFGSTVVKSKW